MSDEAWIMLATLAAMVVFNVIGVVWALASHRTSIVERIRQDRDSDQRAYGETFAALRQKVHDLEVDAWKHFIRREDFRPIIAEMQSATNQRLDKLEGKIDKLVDGRAPHPAG